MRGFTLLEAVIYLALLTVLMGGAVVVGYGIDRNQASDDAVIVVQEEGAFVLAKVRMEASNEEIGFSESGGTIYLTRDGEEHALTSENVVASDFSLTAEGVSFVLNDTLFSAPLP
jgi:hypothetical protein